jgi:hypothetical protein
MTLLVLCVPVLAAAETPTEPLTILVGTGDDTRPHQVLVDDPDPVAAFGVRRSVAYERALVIVGDATIVPPLMDERQNFEVQVHATVIAPPITVERHGLEVRVNGTVVQLAPTWPIERECEEEPLADPGEPPTDLPPLPPDGDTEADQAAVERWFAYWKSKFRWLESTLGGSDKAYAAIVALMQKDPRIRKVEYRLGLSITDTNGNSTCSFIFHALDKRNDANPREFAARATEAYDHFVRICQEGGVHLEIGPYSMIGSRKDCWQALAVAISEQPEPERIKALVELKRISREGEDPLVRKIVIGIWRHIFQLSFDPAVRALINEKAKP